ncbi:MAG: Na+/H+ antiporter subunit D [Chthoniobacterales bacterium]
MSTLIVLPILIPLLAGAFMLLMPNRQARQILNTFACLAHLVVDIYLLQYVMTHGIQSVQLGDWPAPFGISFVVDTLSAAMISITGFTGLLVGIYAFSDIDKEREFYGFYPLYQILIMGVSGAFLTGDLFNMFVWFEVMLMASFVLLALGGERPQLEGAVKYLVLNFLSSSLFLTALGILYAEAGTLNIADLARYVGQHGTNSELLTVAMLLMVAFGLKAGVFPVFSWLPASYHTPPVSVSAIFAGLLTKVGVYALIRVFTTVFISDTSFTHNILIVIALFTMVTGVLGAAAQFEIRKILSFHIISQIGYMVLGLGFFTTAALAASTFYILHHIIVKTNLFLIGGVIQHTKGTAQLKKIGGFYKAYPWLAFLFLIPAMSLGGIPPLSGFFAKFTLVREGLSHFHYVSVAIALLVGVLTLYSMTKIWAEAFWKADPDKEIGADDKTPKAIPVSMWIPILIMALTTLAIGFYPEWLLAIATQAGKELMDPSHYIQAVMNPH